MRRLFKAVAKALGVKRDYAVIALVIERGGQYRIARHFVGAAPWLSAAGYQTLDDWVAKANGVSRQKVQILSVCEVRR